MGFKLDTKEFDAYIVSLAPKQEKVLDEAASIVKRRQYTILVANVKEWTGNLANSIQIHKKGGERRIGPNQFIADYARWIEDGDLGRSSFLGYRYVRNSIIGIQLQLRNLIQKSLERS